MRRGGVAYVTRSMAAEARGRGEGATVNISKNRKRIPRRHPSVYKQQTTKTNYYSKYNYHRLVPASFRSS